MIWRQKIQKFVRQFWNLSTSDTSATAATAEPFLCFSTKFSLSFGGGQRKMMSLMTIIGGGYHVMTGEKRNRRSFVCAAFVFFVGSFIRLLSHSNQKKKGKLFHFFFNENVNNKKIWIEKKIELLVGKLSASTFFRLVHSSHLTVSPVTWWRHEWHFFFLPKMKPRTNYESKSINSAIKSSQIWYFKRRPPLSAEE